MFGRRAAVFAVLLLLAVASVGTCCSQEFPADGVVDVHNDPPLDWVSLESALGPGEAFAQPFTPTLPTLTAVHVGLHVVYAPQGAPCTVEIRESANGPVLAVREQNLSEGTSYYHFSFSPPANLMTRKQYLILLYGTHAPRGPNASFLALITERIWNGPYLLTRLTNGTLIANPYPEPALAFRTYGLEELPTSTTATIGQTTFQSYTWPLAAIIATAFVIILAASLRRHKGQPLTG